MADLDEPSPNTQPPSKGPGEAKLSAAPFWPAAAAVLPPPLPPIAAKHDDLEAIKNAVEDAASVSGPLWLSYLFALFYIALAAAGVAHADLLVENPVKLPFLNIELALKAFFLLAPILFVISHAYTLAHFVLLADKAKRFHQELQRQIGSWTENAAEIRKDLRRQLPSNIFVQFLAGPEDLREGAFGRLLTVIAWVTLVGGPVLLLVLLQLQFLPYHSSSVTWVARGALLVDLVLIWWLVGMILSGRSSGEGWWGLKPKAAKALSALASLGAFVLSWFVLTFPGEWEDVPYSLPPVPSLKAAATAATDWVFGKPGFERDAQVRNWLANTLRLPEFNMYEALKTEPDKVRWKVHTFDLQHRHLEYADLRRSKLDKIDLRDARLQGASLIGAQLQGASVQGAQLQSASLKDAELQGASLERAQLQGASLVGAHLWSASLDDAELQGASLEHAQLQGASLNLAKLQGASLNLAQLQGASLKDAELQGASLEHAQLQGASLDDAKLQGASLEHAELQGASFGHAHLQGASLDDAHLQGASLNLAQLQGASLEHAHLQGASLEEAELRGASLDWAQLQGASLVGAQLQGASLEDTFLWRSDWGELEPDSVAQVSVQKSDWTPVWKESAGLNSHPWNDKSYGDLRKTLENIPQRRMREAALKRVERLDCRQTGETLASCDLSAKPPAAVEAWRRTLEGGGAPDLETYQRALAEIFSDLLCGGDAKAIHLLHGLAKNPENVTSGIFEKKSRLAAAGSEAPKLIEKILEDEAHCPVSAALTAKDRAMLLEIKKSGEDAEAEAEPSPPARGKKPKKKPRPFSAPSTRGKASRTHSVP